MNHPYSGHASYIYANDYLEEENLPVPSSYYYRNMEWIPVPSPGPEPVRTPQNYRRLSRQHSAPDLPPVAFRSDHYRAFSASSHATSLPPISKSSSPPSYVYESMRVRFDTPSPHIMAWRRQLRVMKIRVQRFRDRLSEIFAPRWITSPHPRLSMVR